MVPTIVYSTFRRGLSLGYLLEMHTLKRWQRLRRMVLMQVTNVLEQKWQKIFQVTLRTAFLNLNTKVKQRVSN